MPIINAALSKLDKAKQQSAAEFEEMASTSEELSRQAEQLNSVVPFFNLSDHESGENISAVLPSTASSVGVTPSIATTIKMDVGDDSKTDFERFSET